MHTVDLFLDHLEICAGDVDLFFAPLEHDLAAARDAVGKCAYGGGVENAGLGDPHELRGEGSLQLEQLEGGVVNIVDGVCGDLALPVGLKKEDALLGNKVFGISRGQKQQVWAAVPLQRIGQKLLNVVSLRTSSSAAQCDLKFLRSGGVDLNVKFHR